MATLGEQRITKTNNKTPYLQMKNDFNIHEHKLMRLVMECLGELLTNHDFAIVERDRFVEEEQKHEYTLILTATPNEEGSTEIKPSPKILLSISEYYTIPKVNTEIKVKAANKFVSCLVVKSLQLIIKASNIQYA